MLRLARSWIRPRRGLLFLVVPSPCVQNSRYLDRDRLEAILSLVGLDIVQERIKPGGKLAYFLCQRNDDTEESIQNRCQRSVLPSEFTTKTELRGGASRNNFCVLL